MVSIVYDKGKLEAVVTGLKRMSEGFNNAIYEATFDSILEVHAQAVRNAPYKTGNLRRSLTGAVGHNDKTIVGLVGSNLVYARIQERGGETGRNHAVIIKGKHYIDNSVKANQSRIQQRFQRYLTAKRFL